MNKVWLLIFASHCFLSCIIHAAGERLWNIAQQLRTSQSLVESQQEIIGSSIEEIDSIIDIINSKIDYLSTETTSLQSQIDTIPRILSGYVNTNGTILGGTGFTTTTVSGGVRININTPFVNPPFVVAVKAVGGTTGNPAEVGSVTASTFDIFTYNTVSGYLFQSHDTTNAPVYFLAFGY